VEWLADHSLVDDEAASRFLADHTDPDHTGADQPAIRTAADGPVDAYELAIDVLEEELRRVVETFRSLTSEQWATPTPLRPVDDRLTPWTLFELAGHFDISIGLTRMLLANREQDGQVGRDRVSFFIFPRAEVAPAVYDYAFTMVEGKTPAQMPDVLRETFALTVREARAAAPDTIGSGYYTLMRVDEFVTSRIVEAVVHGMDLTDALAAPPSPRRRGVAVTAALLDELLARRTVAGRPPDLTDDMAWIRAASGRSEHPDPRLPLIG
jgi:hypothetical protein